MNTEAQRHREEIAMPYDDEEPPFVEIDPQINKLTDAVIGAAYAVYKELGAGLDESLYEAAMCKELGFRGISYVCQAVFEVHYKGEKIGERRIDLIVDGKLVIELKAVEVLVPLHKAQLLTYLKITKRKLGLLINFNSALLRDGIKRVINPTGTWN
jgi:GxxExxY protein